MEILDSKMEIYRPYRLSRLCALPIQPPQQPQLANRHGRSRDNSSFEDRHHSKDYLSPTVDTISIALVGVLLLIFMKRDISLCLGFVQVHEKNEHVCDISFENSTLLSLRFGECFSTIFFLDNFIHMDSSS